MFGSLAENYTHLLVNFTFERRLTASIVNTYIPSGLVVVLSWLSFWLDVHAVQGRITLGVTAILTLTTQVVFLSQHYSHNRHEAYVSERQLIRYNLTMRRKLLSGLQDCQ